MSSLQQVIEARPSADGDGVKIHRVAGPGSNRLLDPFLMLDEIQSDQAEDYIGGFPPHPHRGFETITFMFEGGMDHLEIICQVGGHQFFIQPAHPRAERASRVISHNDISFLRARRSTPKEAGGRDSEDPRKLAKLIQRRFGEVAFDLAEPSNGTAHRFGHFDQGHAASFAQHRQILTEAFRRIGKRHAILP